MQISSYNNIGILPSKKQAFGNRMDVCRLAQQYMEEAVDIAQTKWNLVESIKQLTAKYLPSLQIFQKFGLNSAVCRYKQEYDEKAGKFMLKAQEIYIPKRFFILSSITKRADFISDVVHEMTHAFQNCDKDYSSLALINLGLKKRSPEYLKTLGRFSYDIFKKIECAILAPIIFSNNLNNNYSEFSHYTNLDKITASLMDNIDTRIEQELNKALCTPMGKMFKKDKNYILESIKLNLQQEVDAYKQGNIAYKLALDKTKQNPMDVIPHLYARTIESVKHIQK